MDAIGLVWFLVYLGVAVIVLVIVKQVLEYFGIVLPQIVWIILGGIAGILILIWGARMLIGALG